MPEIFLEFPAQQFVWILKDTNAKLEILQNVIFADNALTHLIDLFSFPWAFENKHLFSQITLKTYHVYFP